MGILNKIAQALIGSSREEQILQLMHGMDISAQLVNQHSGSRWRPPFSEWIRLSGQNIDCIGVKTVTFDLENIAYYVHYLVFGTSPEEESSINADTKQIKQHR